MKFLRDKRGIELEKEVPGILVAVIILLIIGGFFYLVYNVYAHQEEKAAQDTINSIEAKVNAVSSESEGRFTVQGVNSKDKDSSWYFVQFDNSVSFRPDKCTFDSCICMCRVPIKGFFGTLRADVWNLFGFGDIIGKENLQILKDSCQKDGYCRKLKGNLYFFSLIKLDSKLWEFDVKKEGDKTCLTCTTCDGFSKCPDKLD